MFVRAEQKDGEYKGLGYSAWVIRHINKGIVLHDWDREVGQPLQDLECRIGLKHHQGMIPVTWKHPRPTHFRDPLLRDNAYEYARKQEHQHLIFGWDSYEKLLVWFPKPYLELMLTKYNFCIKTYTAAKMWHGLRQSMLDYRTIKNMKVIPYHQVF